MQIFNTGNLKNNQRFPVAVGAGIIAAIIAAILCATIEIITRWQIGIVYLGAGLLIGNAIKKFGRGVEPKFSILAVVCVIFSVFLTNFIVLSYGISAFHLNLIPYSIEFTIRTYINFTPQSLISLAIVGYAGYVSYYTARII